MSYNFYLEVFIEDTAQLLNKGVLDINICHKAPSKPNGIKIILNSSILN